MTNLSWEKSSNKALVLIAAVVAAMVATLLICAAHATEASEQTNEGSTAEQAEQTATTDDQAAVEEKTSDEKTAEAEAKNKTKEGAETEKRAGYWFQSWRNADSSLQLIEPVVVTTPNSSTISTTLNFNDTTTQAAYATETNGIKCDTSAKTISFTNADLVFTATTGVKIREGYTLVFNGINNIEFKPTVTSSATNCAMFEFLNTAKLSACDGYVSGTGSVKITLNSNGVTTGGIADLSAIHSYANLYLNNANVTISNVTSTGENSSSYEYGLFTENGSIVTNNSTININLNEPKSEVGGIEAEYDPDLVSSSNSTLGDVQLNNCNVSMKLTGNGSGASGIVSFNKVTFSGGNYDITSSYMCLNVYGLEVASNIETLVNLTTTYDFSGEAPTSETYPPALIFYSIFGSAQPPTSIFDQSNITWGSIIYGDTMSIYFPQDLVSGYSFKWGEQGTLKLPSTCSLSGKASNVDPTPTPTPQADAATSSSAQTGDAAPVAAFVFAVIAAGAGVAVSRKRTN